MKYTLSSIFKWILWLFISVSISMFSFIIAIEAFGWAEHPLGKNLYIYATFSHPTAYDVFLSSKSYVLDYVVPTKYSNAFDTITGKRIESVQKVVRYPDYLAITVVNNIDCNKKYFIVDKHLDPQKILNEQMIDNILLETTDSILFKTRCDILSQHK